MEDRFNVGIGDGNCEDYCHADPWRGRECVEKRLVRVGMRSSELNVVLFVGIVLSVALLGTQNEGSGLSSKHFSYGVCPWKSP